MTRLRWARLALPLALFLHAGCAEADDAPPEAYRVEYGLRLLPDQGTARASISIEQDAAQVKQLRMRIDPQRYFDFEGPGVIELSDDALEWTVPPEGGKLSYVARIDHVRDEAEYDAHVTSSWALFRAEDVFPPTAVRTEAGAVSEATLNLKLPPRWEGVLPFRKKGRSYVIDQPHRRLDFPKGWMLLGDLDVISTKIEGTTITIASPDDHPFHAQDVMALLRWNLPELQKILLGVPDRLLIVGAQDPMWRGGLSGPGSMYVHAARPLIQSDGTSPILHELTHVVTHALAGPDADWIVEGLAELYSLELLRRSGTVDEARHRRTLERLAKRGAKVTNVTGTESRGALTARAVTILYALDAKIRDATDGARSLDDVLRRLAVERNEVTEERFRTISEEVAGVNLERFFRNEVPRG
jgi:hypothetical protein